MNIPDEVIEAAAKAQYEWQDGLPSWENDADGFTKAEYVSQTHAAAQVVAEWARKESLREAAQIAHMVHYAAECSTDGVLGVGMQSRSRAAFEIRNAIRALAEGVSDGQQ